MLVESAIEKPVYGYNPEFAARARANQAKRAAQEHDRQRRQGMRSLFRRIASARIEREGARDALHTALDEVDMSKARIERLSRRVEGLKAEFVIELACYLFDVTREDIVGPSIVEQIALPRQFCCYWIGRRTRLSTVQIARIMGGRDHSTIIHSMRAYPLKRAKQGRTLRRAR